MKRLLCTLVVLTMVIVAPGCSGQRTTDDHVQGSGIKALPDSTLQDWVTYGDHLVVFTAHSVTRESPPAEEVAHGEGLIGRNVHVTLGRARWSRPSLSADIPAIPNKMVVASGGWVFHGKKESPLRIEGQPWIEVGSSYLAVITYIEIIPDHPSWILLHYVPMSSAGVVRLVDAGHPSHAERAVDGKTAAQVATLLRSTAPDPAAKPYMDEDPGRRYQQVAAQGHGPGAGPASVESP